MKTLRITQLEMRNLEIPGIWSVSVDSYFNVWIENKLKEAGFNLTKKYISYKNFETLDLVFEQRNNMEKLTDLKFHCAGCGKELNVKKVRIYYDRVTGKEKYFLNWFCSEVKWYNRPFTKHDFFETNWKGE